MTSKPAAEPHRDVPRHIETLQPRLAGTRRLVSVVGAVLLLAGCRPPESTCNRCDTLIVAAAGEPTTLVPPLVRETVGRDISDHIYERLANLKPGGVPGDSAAFEPGLAASWQRVDSAAWRFALRPGASWQDGSPVTSDDVVFSFAAYADPALESPGGAALEGVSAVADGPGHVVVRFPGATADQLLDATFHVRILPRRLWDSVPRSQWGTDSGLASLIGSGPFRVAEWRRGQSLRLERTPATPKGIQRIVWRFAADQDAALNLVLSGEADLLETAASPAARERASKDSSVVLRPYPSAVYGFLGFRHSDPRGRPHPILSERPVRRALSLAIDRRTLVTAVLGADAAIPAGPVSRALWLWRDVDAGGTVDTAVANHLLDSLGWRRGSGGVRSRGGQRLAIDILVPVTSRIRGLLAEGIQQMWRAIGVEATITAVDFPIFQQRLGQGRFDTMIGASLDQPTPRGIADEWTRAGWDRLNQTRYSNRTFDSLVTVALRAQSPQQARAAWGSALTTLTDDVAAIFLYTPTNAAVLRKQFGSIVIDPFSWLSQAARWMPAQ